MNTVRRALPGDRPTIDALYANARVRMRESGNPNQWGNTKPLPETVTADIAQGQCYVVEENGEIVGVFAFFVGEDPTYKVIDGAWVGEAPYAVLHRVAGAERGKGILAAAVAYAAPCAPSLRMDTHEDNKPMQAALTKAGFTYRGTIWLEDGSPRRAYER